jgi:hypothetical protein
MAKEEILRLEADEKKFAQQIQFGLVPPDPTDSRNTIVEIRAGAGGNESALFSADFTGCIAATPRRAAGKLRRWIPIRPTSAASRKLFFRSTARMFSSG